VDVIYYWKGRAYIVQISGRGKKCCERIFIMTWIKCSDRLPEEDVEVLCWDVNQYQLGRNLAGEMCVWIHEDWDHEDWSISYSVTHWAELPQPPKENE
jgi:hypothetical protein